MTVRFPWANHQEEGDTFFTKFPPELRTMIYKAYFRLHNPRLELQSPEGNRTSISSTATPQKPPNIYTKGAVANTSLMAACRRIHNEASVWFARYFTCIMTSGQVLRSLEQRDFFSNIKTLEIADKHVFQALTWWDGTASGGHHINHGFQGLQQVASLESITLDLKAIGFFTDKYEDHAVPQTGLHEKAKEILNVTLKCTDVGVWQIVEAPKFKVVCKELVNAWSLYQEKPFQVPQNPKDTPSHPEGFILLADTYGCRGPEVSYRLAKAFAQPEMIVYDLEIDDEEVTHNADIREYPEMLMLAFVHTLQLYSFVVKQNFPPRRSTSGDFPVPLPLELWNTDPLHMDPYEFQILLAPMPFNGRAWFNRTRIPVP